MLINIKLLECTIFEKNCNFTNSKSKLLTLCIILIINCRIILKLLKLLNNYLIKTYLKQKSLLRYACIIEFKCSSLLLL